MDLRHLKSFIVMAEELNQRLAAARLGLEQPSLSRQIRELEEELGVPLFHRTTRTTWLSEAGKAFLGDARRIVCDEQLSRERIRSEWASAQVLRIGFSEGLVGAQVGTLLNHLEAPPHDIHTVLVERPLAELVGMLRNGVVDAILAPEQAATADTVSIPAWHEPLMMLVPTHIGGTQAVGLAELGLPFFLPDATYLPGFSQQLTAILPSGTPLLASRFASVATLYALVGTGHGVGVLPMSLAIVSARVGVRPIRTKQARMNFWLTVRKVDDMPAVAALRRAVEAGVIKVTPP